MKALALLALLAPSLAIAADKPQSPLVMDAICLVNTWEKGEGANFKNIAQTRLQLHAGDKREVYRSATTYYEVMVAGPMDERDTNAVYVSMYRISDGKRIARGSSTWGRGELAPMQIGTLSDDAEAPLVTQFDCLRWNR